MAYTSEQYKYMLFRQLQKYFSLESTRDRYYTRDFYAKLLDGVDVTENSYYEFVGILEDNIDYCAKNNVTEASGVTQAMIDERGIVLVDAFARIGITLVIKKESYSGTATFTKPDGSVMVYYVTDGQNDFYINAVCGQEISYARRASPYYQMSGAEIHPLNEVDYQMCGPDCYWSYDADTSTMMITGDGSYRGVTKEAQMGSGDYTTLIFGAAVSELNYNEAYNSSALTTIVLLQPADFPLLITSFGGSTARTWTVYTDNEAFRNHEWGSKLTINWRTLAEWEG